MYWIIWLLARLGFWRTVDVTYNDGKIRQGRIIGEDRECYLIRALVCLSMYYRRYGGNWVDKTDPALGGIRWNQRSRMVLPVLLLLMVVTPGVMVFWHTASQPEVNWVDQATGLPVIGVIVYPDRLPDGHYTVANAGWLSGSVTVIQHQPGPDRNFIYYVSTYVNDNVPDHPQAGQQFTVFRGEAV